MTIGDGADDGGGFMNWTLLVTEDDKAENRIKKEGETEEACGRGVPCFALF